MSIIIIFLVINIKLSRENVNHNLLKLVYNTTIYDLGFLFLKYLLDRNEG